jgi:UDP-N-acetylmuramoyl-tripeptide--D-alanyl-D-alanine ligase
MIWGLFAVSLIATVPAGLRWLRIAQREHYLAPSVTRFAGRWWARGFTNRALFVVALAGVIGSAWSPWLGLLVPLAQVGPVGLGLKGRTSVLVWTDRLRRVAALSGLFVLMIYVFAVFLESALLMTFGLISLPAIIDLALVALAPIEKRMGRRWVDQAAARLKSSGAKVVAITGSYGKTTTKQYAAHLLSGSFRTVASPASFNNRMGLARAINEGLVPGTEVFVAEMGTYGPGEISDLTEWIPPTVSAIVAIGPVHLERFKTEERIVTSKAEILDGAKTAVISVDHPLLAELAGNTEGGKELITVSGQGGSEARVVVSGGRLWVDGVDVASVPDEIFAVNLAAAIGIGMALGVELSDLIGRLDGLPRPEHRQTVSRSERGFSIIDDTFNSNPAGARAGLKALAEVGARGRKTLVTPGMVELGPRQYEENRIFAAEASTVVDDLVIVGSTNRRALSEGAGMGAASVTVVASREVAVEWVRQNLGPGDAVLYENDLPDHYP